MKQEKQNTHPSDKNRHLQFLAETEQQKIRSSDSATKKIEQTSTHTTNLCWTRHNDHISYAKAKVKRGQQNTRPTDKNRDLQLLAETQQQKISSSD